MPLATITKKLESPQTSLHSFSFIITDDYPEVNSEYKPELFLAIGKRGHEILYSLSNTLSTKINIKTLSTWKRELTDLISKQVHPLDYSKDTIQKVQNLAITILENADTKLDKAFLSYLLVNDTIGYGPLSILLDNHLEIEEIVINGPTSNIGVYHSSYGYCTTNLKFSSEVAFRYVINKLIANTERELNLSNPIIDAQLSDGSRIHAQMKPYALNGATASIRLNGGKKVNILKLMATKSVSPELLAYLWMAMEAKLNIVISGAPASGKTSLLMALNAFVPRSQRIITIEEDINELKYANFANVVSLQGSSILGKPSLKEQVVNSLHLRPDRLIVGEIRGDEARDVFSGSNVGVPFMTTMHTNGVGQLLIDRLRSRPMCVEGQLISMLDVAVFMRQRGIKERMLGEVSEYLWLARGEIGVDEATSSGGECRIQSMAEHGVLDISALASSKVVASYAEEMMVRPGTAMRELKRRAAFLKGLLDSGPEAAEGDILGKYGGMLWG